MDSAPDQIRQVYEFLSCVNYLDVYGRAVKTGKSDAKNLLHKPRHVAR